VAPSATPKKRKSNSDGLGGAAEQASSAVRQAASVLETELAAGLAGVQKLERRFTSERRIDEDELADVLSRFRANAHELIDVGSARLEDVRSPDVRDLTQRLTLDAHNLLDTMVNLLGTAPELVDRLTVRGDSPASAPTGRKARSAQNAKSRRSSSSTAPK
jgi:uncharacterized protein YidB (DUF937 family)